ncbi:MAG: Calx-beta domain-containing protein, partial [bacterium]
IGTIALAAAAGKVALTNTTTALVGACPTGGSIVDFVGFGTTASCFEGTGPTPAPSNTTAVIRGGNGCTETDQNATDFTATAPNPRNTVTTFAPCGGGGPITLSINDVTQAEGNAGTSVFTFTVTLSAAAPAGGVTFDIATADGTAQDGNPVGEDNDYVAKSETGRTIAAGGTSATFDVTVNGDTTTEPNETFFVNVTNVTGATVSDGQGLGTITNDDVVLTPIYSIQGSGLTSPFATQSVTTTGIVTGIKLGSSGGFYIQDPTGDGNPATSDGLFVFTGASVPAAAVVGNLVQVSGTVQEFIPAADLNQKPLTELSGGVSVSVLSTGNPLPAPTVITGADTQAPGLENLERFEGMRVQVASLTVVAPTQGTINEPNATVTSNGVFYGVVTGVGRPFREPGVPISDPLPPGSPANVPRFDENPERLRVDSDAQPGTTAVNVSVGSVFAPLTGEMDYSFRTWTILPELTLTGGTNGSATAAPTPTATELTVASFNMERFFDTVDDPTTSDPVLTATAFNNRLNKASLIIRNVQHYPDVIGIEEMENLSTLQAVAAKVNSEAQSIDGLPNPNYVAYLVEGNDIGGIDVGFLVKESRVSTTSVTQIELAGCNQGTGTCNTYTNPNTGLQELLNDRPPLVLVATAPRPDGGTFAFTVIVNHLRSLSGVNDDVTVNGTGTAGGRIRAKRRAQAEFLANYIQGRQIAGPTERIITVGDMNAFNINDGYVDVIGTIKGTPAPPDQVVLASSDLVNPDQTNLVDTLPADQRYSYSFDGNAQVLDQVLVNPPALADLSRFAYARDDADQPVSDYADPNVPDRISDHDQPIAYFSLGAFVPGAVIISEFRFRGPDGSLDEYVELYNTTNSAITVTSSDGTAGWALGYINGSGSGETVAVVIPNGTVIPARGHFLLTNETGGTFRAKGMLKSITPMGIIPTGGYTLTSYSPTDLTYGDAALGGRNDIPDNGAIAIFQTANPGNFSAATRLDAVSLNAAAGATADLYREGTGLPSPGANDGQYAFVRKLTSGLPQDTNDNAQDFLFVSTNGGSYGGVQSQLGAPGPENSIDPIQRNAQIKAQLIEPNASSTVAPNRVRDLTSVINGFQGTLDIRRHFVNTTGAAVTRLRFRVVDITTLNSPGYTPGGAQADVRALDGSDFAITTSRGSLTVRGLTVEQPAPLTQPNGGGMNSSLTVTIPGGMLGPGAAIDVHFLLGVQQGGSYRFFINVEALP